MSELDEVLTALEGHSVVGGIGVLVTNAQLVAWGERDGSGGIQLVNSLPLEADGFRTYLFEVPKGKFYVTAGAVVQLRDSDGPFQRWRFTKVTL